MEWKEKEQEKDYGNHDYSKMRAAFASIGIFTFIEHWKLVDDARLVDEAGIATTGELLLHAERRDGYARPRIDELQRLVQRRQQVLPATALRMSLRSTCPHLDAAYCAQLSLMEEPPWRRVTKTFKDRFCSSVDVTLSETCTLRIKQSLEPDMPIWDASLVLTHYLMLQPPSFLADRRVLELGAGCALVSLACATRGANVTITDLDIMQPLIKENVCSNLTEQQQARTSVQELRWGTDASHLNPPFDFIFASDCIYIVGYFADLAKSIEDLSGPHTRIYMANEHRWRDVDQWWTEELQGRGFSISEVPLSEHHPVYRHPAIKIFMITPPATTVVKPQPQAPEETERLGPRRRIVYS